MLDFKIQKKHRLKHRLSHCNVDGYCDKGSLVGLSEKISTKLGIAHSSGPEHGLHMRLEFLPEVFGFQTLVQDSL